MYANNINKLNDYIQKSHIQKGYVILFDKFISTVFFSSNLNVNNYYLNKCIFLL